VTRLSSNRALAACRMMLGAAFLMNTLEVAAILLRVHEGRLAMPGFVHIPVTPGLIWTWTLVGVAAATLIVVGGATAPACLAAAVLGCLALVWDRQTYSNHLWLTTLLVTYLAFARSDARWSVRALVIGPRQDVPSGPALLLVSQVSVCYFFAGISKLNPWWMAGDELAPTLRLELAGWMLTPLAVAVVATELFIGVGLWFRRTRPLALLSGVCLHVSIMLLMTQPLTLVSFSLACLAVYPLVVDAPYVSSILAQHADERAMGKDSFAST
jgi:hypothetical protein